MYPTTTSMTRSLFFFFVWAFWYIGCWCFRVIRTGSRERLSGSLPSIRYGFWKRPRWPCWSCAAHSSRSRRPGRRPRVEPRWGCCGNGPGPTGTGSLGSTSKSCASSTKKQHRPAPSYHPFPKHNHNNNNNNPTTTTTTPYSLPTATTASLVTLVTYPESR